jgi:tyrosyl-tRNA synthetase
VLTTPLINSWDGTKMSGSRGNYIGLLEAPEEQFGKAMRFPDEMLPELYQLIMEEDAPAEDPMGAKRALARWIVARSHGEEAAHAAEEHFNRLFRDRKPPEEMEEHNLPEDDPVHLPTLLADAFALSTSEARRLISQGGVKLDGDAVRELDLPRARLEGAVLQAGKRRFVRLNGAA